MLLSKVCVLVLGAWGHSEVLNTVIFTAAQCLSSAGLLLIQKERDLSLRCSFCVENAFACKTDTDSCLRSHSDSFSASELQC